MRAIERPDRRLWHPRFVGASAALLIAVFVSDTIYARTLLFQWNNFSAWLLVAGLIAAGCAAVAFLIDLATRRIGALCWPCFPGLSAAALLSIFNALVQVATPIRLWCRKTSRFPRPRRLSWPSSA